MKLDELIKEEESTKSDSIFYTDQVLANDSQEVLAKKTKILNQKIVAKKVLESLAKNDILAIVAGGAPRNWQFETEAKDIDIFIDSNHHDISQMDIEEIFSAELQEKKVELSEFDLSPKEPINAELYRNMKHVHGVFDAHIDGERVQFILFDSKINHSLKDQIPFANEVFESFDFGLCKISMLQKGTYYNTSEFANDFLNKKLTANINNMIAYNNIRSLPRRAEKMKEMYPNFELVIK